MKRFTGLKIGFAVVLLIINFRAACGHAADTDSYFRPFTVNTELVPDFLHVKSSVGPFTGFQDVSLEKNTYRPFVIDDYRGKKNGRPANSIDLPYFRLSFSRSLLDRRELQGKDALRPGREDSDVMRMKSLPSMLRNSSPRETFGAIGDIFQPQLNLEIDF